MADDPNRSRLYQYQHDRSRFACIVYTLAVVFFALSIIQWIIMIAIDGLRDFITDFYYISIVALFISMILVTAFVFFENLRFASPINWLIAIIIVLMTTWGLSRAIVEPNLALFAITVVVVLLLTLIFILFGIFINHDLTLDVVIMFVAAVIFFITSVFFVMMQLLAGVKVAFYIYSIFILITVLMFLMYHAQTINGYRYAEMRINDYLLAALIIYHDMTLLLIMSFYLIAKLYALVGGNGLSLYGESCCANMTDAQNRTYYSGENRAMPKFLY